MDMFLCQVMLSNQRLSNKEREKVCLLFKGYWKVKKNWLQSSNQLWASFSFVVDFFAYLNSVAPEEGSYFCYWGINDTPKTQQNVKNDAGFLKPLII